MTDYTSDQYRVDTETRYPLFSDIQTTDDDIIKREEPRIQRRPRRQCTCDGCMRKLRRVHRPQQEFKPEPSIQLTVDNFVIAFMFLILVFICCFYAKSISELKEQIKALRQLIKK